MFRSKRYSHLNFQVFYKKSAKHSYHLASIQTLDKVYKYGEEYGEATMLRMPIYGRSQHLIFHIFSK